jgi:hypothetical protein
MDVAELVTIPGVTHEFPNTNPRIKINNIEVLADNWYTLRKIDFDAQD